MSEIPSKDTNELKNATKLCTAAISEEEFHRLQKQLLELRSYNYELLEENKRQQNFISNLTNNTNIEALSFATKLVGRKKDKENINDKLENEIHLLRHKLLSQEEDFHLQQSTLLSELNKLVKQCMLLEEKAKKHDEYVGTNEQLTVQKENDIKILMKESSDLKWELSSLKGMLAEKDSLIAEIKTLNNDLFSAKKLLDEEIIIERQRSLHLNQELDEARRKIYEYQKLLEKIENESVALKNSYAELMNSVSTSDNSSQTEDIKLYANYVQISEEEYEKLREYKNAFEKDEQLMNEQKLQNELKMELENAKAVIQAEKEKKSADAAAWEEEKRQLNNKLQMLDLHLQEIQRCKQEEQTSAAQNFDTIKTVLEAKIREGEEEIKKKDEEMKVALKKQSSMVKELRRQVQSEKKRAEQAEKHLDDVLGMGDGYVYPQNGARMRLGGSPSLFSDRCKSKGDAEATSSICSWAFVAEPDKNSLHNFDGEESSCSASILEADNAELISRLAILQKKHAETIDRLNIIEEENTLLRKEVDEKSEVIAQWIRTLPDANHSSQMGVSSPGLRLRRMLEMVRVDESAADIRDMNRRLQRMLEETLSKNLMLEKDIQTLMEKK